MITPEKLKEMGFPTRLQLEIQSRLGVSQIPQHQAVVPAEPKQTTEVKASNDLWEGMIIEICNEISSKDMQLQILIILRTIINNLIEYPKEKKYRMIKLSNEKIGSTIGISKAAVNFLIKVIYCLILAWI